MLGQLEMECVYVEVRPDEPEKFSFRPALTSSGLAWIRLPNVESKLNVLSQRESRNLPFFVLVLWSVEMENIFSGENIQVKNKKYKSNIVWPTNLMVSYESSR